MDQLRSALTTIKDWLGWLANSIVALLIIALAGALAIAIHTWAGKLTRRLLTERYVGDGNHWPRRLGGARGTAHRG